MSQTRVSDLAILLGHALQCDECRRRLLEEPDRVIIGRKIAPETREKLMVLTAENFESAIALAAAVAIGLPLYASGGSETAATTTSSEGPQYGGTLTAMVGAGTADPGSLPASNLPSFCGASRAFWIFPAPSG